MDFEFDPDKSAANRLKHGIDVEAAKALWSDPLLLVVPACTDDEPRFLGIGRIATKHWACIWTWRGVAVRLISVRRARKEEIERYEGQ